MKINFWCEIILRKNGFEALESVISMGIFPAKRRIRDCGNGWVWPAGVASLARPLPTSEFPSYY